LIYMSLAPNNPYGDSTVPNGDSVSIRPFPSVMTENQILRIYIGGGLSGDALTVHLYYYEASQ
jgi:hypothetical protein